MINLILSDTKRSLNYVDEIIKNKIKINKIILYSKKYGALYKFLKNKNLQNLLIHYKTNSINSTYISKKLLIEKTKLNIISTYPGEIVKNQNLLNQKIIHCHSGDLPSFKGSTTIYYSILLKRKICVTIFIMNSKIDNGKIVYKKYFNNPKNLNDIEKDFDNKIRAITLVEYLKTKKKYVSINVKDDYLPYFIAHPIIRQLVLNKEYLK